MKKRLIALLLTFSTVINMLAASGMQILALSMEDVSENVQKIVEKVEADGFTEEYILFTAAITDRYEFSEEEILTLYSLPEDDIIRILTWLRKFVTEGKKSRIFRNLVGRPLF